MFFNKLVAFQLPKVAKKGILYWLLESDIRLHLFSYQFSFKFVEVSLDHARIASCVVMFSSRSAKSRRVVLTLHLKEQN